jgi:hypothetical protein
MLKCFRAILLLLLLIPAAQAHFHFGLGRFGAAPPAPPPVPTVVSIALSGSLTYPNGSPSGTVIGLITVTMSFGSFSGALSLHNGGFDSFGTACDPANTTNFQIVAGNLELNKTLSGAYNVCVVAVQGSSSLTQAFTITGTSVSQTIASVFLSSGGTFPAGSGSGTTAAMVGVTMSPSSPVFSGSLALVGTGFADQHGTPCSALGDFSISGNTILLATTLSAGTYPGVCVQAVAGSAMYIQAFTLTAATAAITNVSLQTTTFVAGVPNIPVGAVMPTLTNGSPFTSAPFTGSLAIVTAGTDSNGNSCTTNGNHFQVLSASLQLAANGSGVSVGSYPGVCVAASQAGYASWTQAFTLAAGAAPANQIVLKNVSGSDITNYKYQFGRAFLDGAVSSGNCPIININGSPAAQSQFDVKNVFPDGSVRFGVGAVVIPTLTNNVATTLTFTVGACNNTALTKAQMLAGGFNFDGTETVLFPAAVLTGAPTRLTTLATFNAVTNGGFNITINGNPLSITGLNFSAATSKAQIATIVQTALNAALGTSTAVQVWDLGGSSNLNEIFVISVLGAGKTISAATAGSGTDISAMLGWTGGTLYSNTAPTTQVVSARTMLNNGNYALWTSGPVAQTIILADDSSGAAYDVGNDGFHAMRPRIYATFWSGDNSVSVRFAGEQNKSTQLEDMSYGVTLATGSSSPTQQYQLDLSGTGNAFGEGQTGWSAASAKTVPIAGNLTVTGSLSGPTLSTSGVYFFDDLNISRWCQFKYVNTTTITITDQCSQNFTGGAPSNISIGDTLVVGNPKYAWTRSSWILPGGGSYWINGSAPSPMVNVDQNLAYMEYAREVPNFDPTVTLSGTTVTNEYASWSPGYSFAGAPYDGSWDGGPAIMPASMGIAGGNPWLGILPNWQVYWLYSGDWRMRLQSIQHADLSGAYPTQIRETDPTRKLLRGGSAGTGLGLPIAIAGRPGIQVNSGGFNASNLCTIAGVDYGRDFCFGPSDNLPVIPGSAAINHGDPWVSAPGDHLVSEFHLPYVETGDPWYLNEGDLWMSDIEASNPPYNAVGTRGPNGTYCNFVDEFRGEAWFGLSMAEYAVMAPDADPFKPWLVDCENDMLAMWEGALGITGTVYDGTPAKTWAAPLLDPESSSGVSPSTLPHHTIPTQHDWQNFFDAPVTQNTFEKTGMWVPGVDLGILDPWMFHYMTLSIGRATELGFAAGAIQSYLGQVYSGWANSAQYSPYLFNQYGAPVEKQPTFAGGGFFPDWPTLLSQGYTSQWLTGVGWTMNVTAMAWNGTSGGQATVTTALPNAVDVGGQVTIAGATNTGSGGAAAVNKTFTVFSVTDNQDFTLTVPASAGVIGTIGGAITGVIVAPLGAPASSNWSGSLTTSGDGGRLVWATGGNAMMTDNGVSPWGMWWGINSHAQIPDWSTDTHWDVVPRTDANALPAQPTTTPP